MSKVSFFGIVANTLGGGFNILLWSFGDVRGTTIFFAILCPVAVAALVALERYERRRAKSNLPPELMEERG